MSQPIENYALISDCQTAALVSHEGSIDWLCLPRFDSDACFASLLGSPGNGRWLIAPDCDVRVTSRRYCGDTLVLETRFETEYGVVKLIDCMPPRSKEPDLIRMVVGEQGDVPMRVELVIRFGYGSVIPWVRRSDGGILAVAGPDTLRISSPVRLYGENFTTKGEFTVSEGDRLPFVMVWYPSHEEPPPAIDAEEMIAHTQQWWQAWSDDCAYDGPWRDAVKRSLITLKGLTYAPTGGIVAAPTASLPESLGGVRNWDYRYCWLRDATITLFALLKAGCKDEARAWREWLLRAVAGNPEQLQPMYGIAGERRLIEWHADWLDGYEGSRPVRFGNSAYLQSQLDVIGEVMDALHLARRVGLAPDENAWRVQQAMIEHIEKAWDEPDHGIWEVRGEKRHFVHSKVMAWTALDRAVKSIEQYQLPGATDRWRDLRGRMHEEICRKGFDQRQGTFVQYYGSSEVDASLLMIPLVGFLAPDDARVIGTVEAVERELTVDGFVQRYRSDSPVDGLPEGEGAFLLCSFWLADCLALIGRREDAIKLFERLLDLRNDVGLLAEEYDPRSARMVGNFPQAFSHVALVNTAYTLSKGSGIAEERGRD